MMARLDSLRNLSLRVRRMFERMNTREQVLLLAFLCVILIVWGVRVAGNLSDSMARNNRVASEMRLQELWIHREPEIVERLDSVLQDLDSKETYSANRLLGKLDEILQESTIKATLSRPVRRQGEVFVEHVVTIALERVPLKSLIDFEQRMRSVFPYIGIEYMMIRPENANPELLRGELRVTSFELAS